MMKQSAAGRGYGISYNIQGLLDDGDRIERHRIQFLYRRPIYKRWLYLDIVPEIEWRNDNSWEPVPTFIIGFDALFWGVGDR